MSYHKRIIDPKTGKRVDNEKRAVNKALKKSDPIKRNIEKDLEVDENSPMDPPDAYDATKSIEVSYEQMPAIIQKFMDEHKVGIEKLDSFEKGLIQFKENGYGLNDEINNAFGEFFKFFENNIMDHNQREEKILFPLLHKRLIESGEHGEGDDPQTAIDMMEDDHIKFIQLGALTFNLLGLAARLPDKGSKMFVYDVAFSNGQELIELLRLHIYREDHIIFPLAFKLISTEEFSNLALLSN
ncbi:MAG: hemerythrin domain-containing protein [Altibacter sp.]|uniref:hemerythrin domain-containing protein n=1 Tax=Altibacter sp. TaxID=2024823 RepID=UPI001D621EF2|nr:hemerythrin domain-containing protein [Altibacter sp.]MBZ0327728.1 hemerythrin domain-containing protein [Altibacter sp.]